jgi:hypothetical protein
VGRVMLRTVVAEGLRSQVNLMGAMVRVSASKVAQILMKLNLSIHDCM